MRSKKGQAEDIFSDLIPAIIFLIIGLILIAKVDTQSKTATDKLMQNNIVADRMAALMVFKSPVDAMGMNDFVENYFEIGKRPANYRLPIDPKAAAEVGFSGNFIDFMNRLRLIRENDKDKIQMLKDTRLAEFFSYDASIGDVGHGSNAAFKCGENLYWYMYEYLLGGEYSTWVVRVYEEDANSDKNRLLFICTSQMYKYRMISGWVEDLEKDTKSCFAENTQRFDRALLFGPLGGKGNSMDRDSQMFSVETRFPSPDTSKVLVGFVDYSREPCPLDPGKERIYNMREDK